LGDAFLKEVLVDLRDEVWRLKRENGELQTMLAEADDPGHRRRADVSMSREVEALKSEVATLVEANSLKDREILQLRSRGNSKMLLWLLACFIAIAMAIAMLQ
jgi:predicted RNase H-like nuclease (RuvC/YqgF family)